MQVELAALLQGHLSQNRSDDRSIEELIRVRSIQSQMSSPPKKGEHSEFDLAAVDLQLDPHLLNKPLCHVPQVQHRQTRASRSQAPLLRLGRARKHFGGIAELRRNYDCRARRHHRHQPERQQDDQEVHSAQRYWADAVQQGVARRARLSRLVAKQGAHRHDD